MGNRSSSFLFEINGLKCLEKIGEGCFAKVYKAKWKGEIVAAKQLMEDLYFQEEVAERFNAECATLRGLEHRNIVKMIDLVVPGGEIPPILITELLHCDLAQHIKEQTSRISTPKVVNIMLDVAEGLKYLHDRPLPIAHRDLASKNVLLTENGTAKIADLGLARVFVCQGTTSLRQYGTLLYAAPETFHHRSEENGQFVAPVYDVRVDVFSFGVLLLEVINGDHPRPVPWMSPVTETGIIIPEHKRRGRDISEMGKEHRLSNLVLRCLENDKKARPTATEIIDNLNKQKEKIDRKAIIGSTGRPKLKFLALGGPGAGKTSIVQRFLDPQFDCEAVLSTPGGNLDHITLTHNGIAFDLQMEDTAGQERYDSIPPILLRDLDAALLVFDMSDLRSFNKIKSYIQMIASHSKFEVSMILVGNKADTYRKVQRETAQAFANNYHSMPYIETSAKTGQNIERLFELAVEKVYDRLDLADIEIYFPSDVSPMESENLCDKFRAWIRR